MLSRSINDSYTIRELWFFWVSITLMMHNKHRLWIVENDNKSKEIVAQRTSFAYKFCLKMGRQPFFVVGCFYSGRLLCFYSYWLRYPNSSLNNLAASNQIQIKQLERTNVKRSNTSNPQPKIQLNLHSSRWHVLYA